MNLIRINKIIAPIYLYIALLAGYFIIVPYVSSDNLGNVMLYSVALGLPIVFWFWINMKLRKIIGHERRNMDVILVSSIPGFFPGAIFGFGVWGMAHGDTVISFIAYTLACGIPTAFIFGVMGLLLQSILNRWR